MGKLVGQIYSKADAGKFKNVDGFLSFVGM